jgi:hypothetical protein
MGKKEWAIEVDESLVAELKHAQVIHDDGGMLLEHAVDKYAGMKMEIFSDEHPPPHFRITVAGKQANYAIDDCRCIAGTVVVDGGVLRKWHAKNKQALINKWNKTRPTDCPVGDYRAS